MSTMHFSRPSDVYVGEAGLINRAKYQGDSGASPKVPISSSKVDGDFNYIIDALNQLYDSTVSSALPDGSVTNVKFSTGTGGAIKCYNAAGTLMTDLAPLATAGYVLTTNGTGAVPSYKQVTATGLANNAVTSSKILDGNVTTSKIADGAVTAIKLAAGVVAITGSIIMWPTLTAPTGYLLCDGSAVSRTTYSALFAVIGTTFGPGDGSSTFNLPDARGQFIRGWSVDSTVDPDGPRNPGTTQADELRSHIHPIKYNTIMYNTGSGNGGYFLRNSASTTTFSTAVGGAETRPTNLALVFCIKY